MLPLHAVVVLGSLRDRDPLRSPDLLPRRHDAHILSRPRISSIARCCPSVSVRRCPCRSRIVLPTVPLDPRRLDEAADPAVEAGWRRPRLTWGWPSSIAPVVVGRKPASGNNCADHAGGRWVTRRAGTTWRSRASGLTRRPAAWFSSPVTSFHSALRAARVTDGIVGQHTIRACSPASRLSAHAPTRQRAGYGLDAGSARAANRQLSDDA